MKKLCRNYCVYGLYLGYIIAFAMLTSCAGNVEEEKQLGGVDEKELIKADEDLSAFEGALTQKEAKFLLKTYYKVKDALVETDEVKSKEAALALESIIPDGKQVAEFGVAVHHLAKADNISDRRVAFEEVSVALRPLVKAAKIDEVIYEQYCPMAFDDKGAPWLSNDSEIMNPYFGDEMLHCGRLNEKILANK